MWAGTMTIPTTMRILVLFIGSHNFILIRGDVTFGAFFRLCRKNGIWHRLYSAGPDADQGGKEWSGSYIITGENEKDIVKQFRKIIGRSYIPPFWAFGYGQSRWGYKTEQDIREVAKRYQAAGIPLDSIYLDIDYMERYKDFTVDSWAFPNSESS